MIAHQHSTDVTKTNRSIKSLLTANDIVRKHDHRIV